MRPLLETLRASFRLPASEYIPGSMLEEEGVSECLIAPAFYYLIAQLTSDNRDFRVVLRGPPSDLPELCNEWNAFCSGSHPRHKESLMDGSGDTEDRRVHPPQSTAELVYDEAGPHLAHASPETGFVSIAHGFVACASALSSITASTHSVAIAEASGTTPMFLHVDCGPMPAEHHVCFCLDEASVDCRDRDTSDIISIEEAKGQWIIVTDPIRAFKEPAYFAERVAAAESQLGVWQLMQK